MRVFERETYNEVIENLLEDHMEINEKTFVVQTIDGFVIRLKKSNENFVLAIKYSKLTKAEIDNIALREVNEKLKTQLDATTKDASEVDTLRERLHLAEEHITMLKFLVKQSRKNLEEKQIWVQDEDDEENPIDTIWHLKSKSKEKECREKGWFHLGNVKDYTCDDYTFYNPYNI